MTLAGIVKDCFPEVRVRSFAQLPEGWADFVIEINGRLIFRSSKRPDAEDNLKKEIRLLPELSNHLTFRTRKVLDEYDGVPGPGIIRRVRLYLTLVPFHEIIYGLDFDRPHVKYGLDHLKSRLLR